MAVKKVKFQLPDGKVLNAEVEETITVSTFIDRLKVREILLTNGNYEFRTPDGSLVGENSSFGSFPQNELEIIDLDAATTTEEFDLSNIGEVDTPRHFHQLGVFVLDGSGSMSAKANGGITKSGEVNNAIRDLFTRFKASSIKQNFSFAVVTFDTRAEIKMDITEAVEVDDNENYNPQQGHGGGTNIYEGLEMARKICDDFLSETENEGVPNSAIILLMTDGMCHNGEKTMQVADEIKNGKYGGQTTICATYFGEIGKNSNEQSQSTQLLRAIVTNKDQGYKTVYNTEALRKFFEKSISLASGATL